MNIGNPYRSALFAISIAGAFLALVFIFFGVVAGNSAATGQVNQVAPAISAIGIGAALLQLSGICFLLWLVVSAIGWHSNDKAPVQSPSLGETRPGGSKGTGHWLDDQS